MVQRKKIKVTSLDIGILIILLLAVIYLVYRVTVGIHYRWNWSVIPQYLFRYDTISNRWVPNLLMQGFLTTIKLSIWATLLAMVIGTIMGIFRISPRLFKRMVSRSYVEMIRNMPPLVLVFIFYFFVSGQLMTALGVDEFIRNRSETTLQIIHLLFVPPAQFTGFISALITLSLYEGAYIAEIVRGGILSVEKGQWEAARAMGFTYRQQLQEVILPQAFQKILPPLAGQFISTIKDSAIMSIISIQELTFQGMELMASTYLTFEIWITIMLLYFMLTFSLSLVVRKIELRYGPRTQ
jgi:polar amino acid transport system permease protein